MTTILLVILGVLLAAAAVLMVMYYGGDAFGNGRIEAEAGRLVTEGAQIEGAMELYYRQEGSYPRDADPIAQMIAAKYLTHAPLGTRTTEADKWSINYDAGMIRAKLGPTSDKDTKNICLKARQQLDLPAAGTSSGIYRCDGTDSPGGKLGGREPCCVGEVGVGGGTAAIPPKFTQPDTCGTAPPTSASSLDRATWLVCYTKEVKNAAVYWIYAGQGLTPTTAQLYDAGFIHSLPPSYPEMTRVWIQYTTVNSVKSSRILIDLNGPAGMTASSNFGTVIANNSGGLLTKYGSSYWMVYTAPIYTINDYSGVLKTPTWDRSVPSAESSIDEQAAYAAYRLLTLNAYAKDALAKGAPYTGSSFTIQNLAALGYAIPAAPSGGSLGDINYSSSGLYYYHTNTSSVFADSQKMCNLITDNTYGQAPCDSYRGYHNNMPKIPAP